MREHRIPSPTYFSQEQIALYLTDLRKPPPARPSGSRPPPAPKLGSLRRADNTLTPASLDAPLLLPARSSTSIITMQPTQKLSHRRTDSSRSPFAGRPLARAPSASPEPALSYSQPRPSLPSTSPSEPALRTYARRKPSISYLENGTRWMEKQETQSLRRALEDMDIEEERRTHASAQDEAIRLVWNHQNPELASGPFVNPDFKPRDYRSHLRRGSYHRSHSQDALTSGGSRSASEGSQGSATGNTDMRPGGLKIAQEPRKVSPPSGKVSVQKRRESTRKSYDHLAEAVAQDIAIAHRRSSSGSKRIMSGEKKKFMHPEDRIWEDPAESDVSPAKPNSLGKEARELKPDMPPAIPSYARRNPFARVRAQYEKNLERSNSPPALQTLNDMPLPRYEQVEIQRNPPSQSRNAFYTSNEVILPPSPPVELEHEPDDVAPKTTPTNGGKEIRGDDIRAATSKARSAYSPNLPRPTMVSDKPGRPIVSFQKDYKPKEIVMEEQHVTVTDQRLPSPPQLGNPDYPPSRVPSEPRHSPSVQRTTDNDAAKFSPSGRNEPDSPAKSKIPRINITDVPKWMPSTQPNTLFNEQPIQSPVPTICGPDDLPVPTNSMSNDSISALDATVPTINFQSDRPASGGSPTNSSRIPQRPLSSVTSPRLPQAGPAPSSGRPLPRHANTTPIPQSRSTPHYTPSFRQSNALCTHCALPIAGRILSAAGERFHPGCFVCHQCNTNLECVAFYPEPERQRAARLGNQSSQGEDPTLRFYCHLDFHELFSPRCKSCKTPIEGEVIVACGAEWHAGHFFCAQCGDPFDLSMPFVEKDGYAWCVGCHTNRYSSKCRKCKKPVTDVVVKALGSDWHSNCFTCMECDGVFEAGRYFLRGDSQDYPVCVSCEERRLKAA